MEICGFVIYPIIFINFLLNLAESLFINVQIFINVLIAKVYVINSQMKNNGALCLQYECSINW